MKIIIAGLAAILVIAFACAFTCGLGVAFACAFTCGLGVAFAWLFAQFGVFKPWWVFSIGWILLGFVGSLFRSGK